MNASSTPAAERLRRLAIYVEQDPFNKDLLAEACDAALLCGEHELAETYLAAGERGAPDALDWQFRRARLCLARREIHAARDLLERLRTDSGEHPAVLHDLAYVHLLLGDPGSAQALLAPCIDEDLPPELAERLQALWLRACHEQGGTSEAWAWIRRKQQQDALQGEAAGVASLLAWDEEQASAAANLADTALSQRPAQREALITRGLLALAARDAARALVPLREALVGSPEDARVLSSLGLACLLAGDAAQAEAHLRKAANMASPHPQTLQALGWARVLIDDRKGAIEAFCTALQQDDEAADVHASLALVHFMNGETEHARAHLERAERIGPKDETTRVARMVLAGGAHATARDALLKQILSQWSPRA